MLILNYGLVSSEPLNVYKQRFQMKENTLKKLKSLLLNRRREMLEQVAHLEFERDELGQHFIESIDMMRTHQ